MMLMMVVVMVMTMTKIFAFHFYIFKLPINRLRGRYVTLIPLYPSLMRCEKSLLRGSEGRK